MNQHEEGAHVASEDFNTTTAINESRPAATTKRQFPKRYYNVIMLSFAFMFIITAYSTTQNYVTTLHGSAGYESMAALYASFSLSNFFSPSIENVLGPRASMIIAAVPYASFVLVAGFNNNILLIVMAVLVGIGAALLWTAHGDFLTRVADGKDVGLISGIFFAIFSLNGIIGNLLIAALFSFGVSQLIAFIVLFCVAVVGVGCLFLLMKMPKPSSARKLEREPPVDGKSVSRPVGMIIGIFTGIVSTIKTIFDIKMLFFAGFIFHTGYSVSFFTGVLPAKYPKDLLGYIMAVYGLASVIGSIILGKGADMVGKRYTMMATFAAHALAAGLSWLVFRVQQNWLYFVYMFVCGIADSGSNTQSYAILQGYFEKNASDAFAGFKFVQSLATAFGFLSGRFFSYEVIQYILVGILGFSFVSFCVLDCFIAKVDRPKEPASEEERQPLATPSAPVEPVEEEQDASEEETKKTTRRQQQV